MARRDRVDQRVEIERRQVRVLSLYKHHVRYVVPGQVDLERIRVVQIGKGYAVLGAHRLANDDFVDVIEFVPVFVVVVGLFDERLESVKIET